MTQEQKQIIQQALALQAEFSKLQGREISARAWSQKLGVSPTTWARLAGGNYEGNTARWCAEIQSACAKLKGSISQRRAGTSKDFLAVPDFVLTESAIQQALARAGEGSNKRLVWFLAPQGCGKTEFGRQLVEREYSGDDKRGFVSYSGTIIVARQSWKGSYFSALVAIARSIGIMEDLRSAGAAETQILARLNLHTTPFVLFFDEPEYFGREVLNLLKTLCNETRAVLVMLCQPKFYEETRTRGGIHAAQLLRRSIAVISHKDISANEASHFLRAKFPQAPAPALLEAARQLATAANLSGGFDACREIAASMSAQEMQCTARDVEAARQLYHKTVGFLAS